MASFARIDDEGNVLEVINASFAFIASGAVGDHEDWVQTYPDGSKRGRYAGTGMKYDRTLDKFITSKPHPSWTLNSGGNWEAPVAYPSGANPTEYMWDEDTTSWVINNSEG